MPSPTALVALAFVLAMPRPPAPPDLRAERDAIRAREAKALDDLAARSVGDAHASAAIVALREPPPAADGSSRFVPLGEVIPPAKPLAPEGLRKVRLDAAGAFFELATKALKA